MTLYHNKYRTESPRLPGWDYASPGYYFVTICTRDRVHHFGEITRAEMVYSPAGQVARRFWLEIPTHFAHVAIDAFVIMPDHVHGIIIIQSRANDDTIPDPHPRQGNDVGGFCRDAACCVSTTTTTTTPAAIVKPGSLAAIVRSYKSAVARQCHLDGISAFAWQGRYYDRIIFNDAALERVRGYIQNNPARWEQEKEKPIDLMP